jgi:nucleotide-binding universal stress UspA family protein
MTPVLVPSRPQPTPRGCVVVGLRGSGDAADALAVGFSEAARRGTDLAVTVIRDAATETSADDLLAVVAAAGRAFPAVPVTTSLRTGQFSEVLIDLSRSADLVVLGMGRRPSGMGRTDLLVATHADCPVIVVRENAKEAS